MEIELDYLDIVWLQEVKREPGEHVVRSKEMVNLLKYGMVREDGRQFLHLTEAGEEALNIHTPFSFRDFREPVGPLDFSMCRKVKYKR